MALAFYKRFAQAVFLALAFLTCTQGSPADSGALKVLATTGMIADIVAEVGGKRVEVKGLMGAGVDPHLYKPTRSDMAELNRAEVVFYNGLLLEGKMADALIRVAGSGKRVFPVTEILDAKFLLEPEGFDGLYDPHVWMDPQAWIKAVEVVRDKLTEVRPLDRETFAENAKSYIEKLKELDAYAEKVLGTVDVESRVLVTAHDAFNYFGRRYGYEVLGIQGLSTESEAGVLDIEQIVESLVKRKISAVFIESTVSKKNVQALIEGAKARGHEVKIGGELFSDAMGAPGTYKGTYLGMIDHNVTVIARALGGQAPERGKLGNLAVE